jgi:hypothetical protein
MLRPDDANRWLGVGALSTAAAVAMTWVCCLPILAGLVGVTAASVGAQLEPARPYLLLSGAMFVAVSLYLSYRAPKVCADGPCSPGRPRRRAFLWFCAAAVMLSAAMPYLIALWVRVTL